MSKPEEDLERRARAAFPYASNNRIREVMASLSPARDEPLESMKDPCPTCDGDGVLGTSPDSPPCPECMGGEVHFARPAVPRDDDLVEAAQSIHFYIEAPPPFSHGDCYLEPGKMPCGTCFPTRRARWDAEKGDPQDWEDLSAEERTSVRRAIHKFQALTEPARKPATGAASHLATRPATISNSGQAAVGNSVLPPAAGPSRGAR